MFFFKKFYFIFLLKILFLINCEEEISISQKIFEFLNYGPVGLLWGVLPMTIDSLNLTDYCQLSIKHTLNSLNNGQTWSNSLILSSGKGFNDLLKGTYLNLGNYDECLSIISTKINSLDKNYKSKSFQGKYCLLNLRPNSSILTPHGKNDSLKMSEFLNLNLNISQKLDTLFKFEKQIHPKLGFCVPSTCSDLDVKKLITSVLNEYSWNIMDSVDCDIKKTFKEILDESGLETKISFYILVTLVSLSIISTIFIIIFNYQNGYFKSLINCFFIKKNFLKFVSTDIKKNHNFSLNIFQSFVILFCVISHCYLYFIWLDNYVAYENIYDYLFNVKNIFFQPFVNIFDINTGLLFLLPSTYACLKIFSLKNISFLNCIKKIFSQLIRNVPLIGIIIVLQFCLPLVLNGPLAKQFLNKNIKSCSDHWYKTLLFINNFDDFDVQCSLHTWTISIQMQLFIVLTFMVLLYSKYPCLAKIVNLVFIFSSLITIIYLAYTYQLPPQFLPMPFNLKKLKVRAKLIHFSLTVHVFEYFLPLFVFGIILKKKTPKFQLATKRLFLYMLILAFVIIQFYSFPFSSLDFEGTRLLNTFVIITCKLTLPVFFSWVIYSFHGTNFEDIFKEISLIIFFYNIFSETENFKSLRKKEKLNHLNNYELKNISTSINFEEESDNLMLNKNNSENDPHINSNIVKKVNKLDDDKLIVTNSLKLSSVGNLLLIYSKLAKSIYLSHHFYLIYDLYSIRKPLLTDHYHIVARLTYNLFYIHLVGFIFYIFIELPIISLSSLLSKSIKNFELQIN